MTARPSIGGTGALVSTGTSTYAGPITVATNATIGTGGGTLNITAGVVYAVVVGLRRAPSAGDTVRTMIRAEAAKITLIVLQLWLVLMFQIPAAPVNHPVHSRLRVTSVEVASKTYRMVKVPVVTPNRLALTG